MSNAEAVKVDGNEIDTHDEAELDMIEVLDSRGDSDNFDDDECVVEIRADVELDGHVVELEEIPGECEEGPVFDGLPVLENDL